jgi:hypothetical protein
MLVELKELLELFEVASNEVDAIKYLGVQASSAAVERMFSISGHKFSLKRRRLGYAFFTDLVFFLIE